MYLPRLLLYNRLLFKYLPMSYANIAIRSHLLFLLSRLLNVEVLKSSSVSIQYTGRVRQ